MISRILPLFALLVLVGCETIPGSGGIAGYYSNQPNGEPRIRITQGLGGYQLAVNNGTAWTPGRPLKRLSTANDDILKTIPWLSEIVESAYGLDGFTFFKFKPNAQLGGEKLPTSYYLAPGGFAYRVSSSGGPQTTSTSN